MVLNDLVDSFCYSQKNAGLKGLKMVRYTSMTLNPSNSCNLEQLALKGLTNERSRFKNTYFNN